ncbi:MAG: hypothetical protein KF764_03335 [Labilithrix sp.]|nr:hypothetical protein [Labilithrix sp.]
MMGARTLGLLGVVAGTLFGAGAIGCSAPPSSSTPLLVCEAGEDGCPSDKTKTPKQATSKKPSDDDGPSGSPAPASTPDDDEAADAGPAADPEPGPICTKLKGCCDQLKAAGYSDATCLEIVGTKSENACSLQHKQYRDYGDCT